MAKKNDEKIKITLKKGLIRTPKKHIKIVEALGLGKKDSVVEHNASPTIMGMVNKISHLVEIVK